MSRQKLGFNQVKVLQVMRELGGKHTRDQIARKASLTLVQARSALRGLLDRGLVLNKAKDRHLRSAKLWFLTNEGKNVALPN